MTSEKSGVVQMAESLQADVKSKLDQLGTAVESAKEQMVKARTSIKEKVLSDDVPILAILALSALRLWFFVYDRLNYLPYQLLNPPAEKLRMSSRVKAKFLKRCDGPIRNVEGTANEFFEGKDTVDKLWRHVVELYDDSPCFGTRQLLAVHEDKQRDGRVFEKLELGAYEWSTYREIEDAVKQYAGGLALAAKENSESKVCIFAETRAHWMTTALSCFRANLPVVTVYATLGEEAIAQAINETESTILVTSAELLEKVSNLAEKCPSLRTVVYFPPINRLANFDVEPFKQRFDELKSMDELRESGKETPIVVSNADPEDIALIMYTSGTTGKPKGVVLLHQNIIAASAGQAFAVNVMTHDDTYIGYLPLAHILELSAELTCLSRGCRIGYSSPLTLHDRASKVQPGTRGDCFELRPTLMAAVPAIMDRIYKAVNEEVAAQPRFMQKLFKLYYERKRSRYEEGYCSPFLDRLIFKKIRLLLGGQLRFVLSGGAPLNPETQRFMNICMCCPVIQGYGLTETCGAATIGDVHDLSTGSVGPPLRCADILLREWTEGGYSPCNDPAQGEILIAGKHVAAGYWKQPEKTAEDFVEHDGRRYFCTGDIGEKREDGSLKIIDRKKDLVKLVHGEYVSLAKVECSLLTCQIVDNVCIYGDSFESCIVGLILPNQKHLERIAEEVGSNAITREEMCSDSRVVDEYTRLLTEHGKKSTLSKIELPAAYTLIADEWTPSTGLLTEALKLKRKPIQTTYQEQINKMYGKPSPAA